MEYLKRVSRTNFHFHSQLESNRCNDFTTISIAAWNNNWTWNRTAEFKPHSISGMAGRLREPPVQCFAKLQPLWRPAMQIKRQKKLTSRQSFNEHALTSNKMYRKVPLTLANSFATTVTYNYLEHRFIAGNICGAVEKAMDFILQLFIRAIALPFEQITSHWITQ